jgi:RND family efflux transporter MFP subunit
MSSRLARPRLTALQALAVAAVLAATVAGGVLAVRRFAPQPVGAARPPAVPASTGPIASTVTATGNVTAGREATLGFTASGQLIEVLVQVGDQVAAGQSLARIDGATLETALSEARAALATAEAQLAQVRAGSKPEEVRAAEAQVASARLQLEQAEAAIGGPDLSAAQSQVESARLKLEQLLAGANAGDLAAAQVRLDGARARLAALHHPRPEDVAVAESQLASARAKLAALHHPRPEDVAAAESQLASARARLEVLHHPRPEDVAAAQSQLDQARTRLAQLQDQPKTATPQDIANAELAVASAQVALDRAHADAAAAGRPGSGLTEAAAKAAVDQALINLQQAQNNLDKLKSQGPSDWEVRQAQLAVEAAEAGLAKLRQPSAADLAGAQAAVAQAEAQLQKLTSPDPQEVQLAQDAVTQAEANLAKLRQPPAADLASAEQAVAEAQAALDKLVTPNGYEVESARHGLAQAQASLDKLRSAQQYELQAARLALASAQAALDAKQAGPAAEDLAAAEAAVAKAAAGVAQAERNLQGATLLAPFAGAVAAISGQPGEPADTFELTLVDTSQLLVDAVLDELDVTKVQVGQSATVRLDSLPELTLVGRVFTIAPVATVENGVATYAIQLQVDSATGVRPGMTATATITTASKADALVVPSRAIRRLGQLRTVDVLAADGKTETRQVETGITGDGLTEIVSGLQPGEQVLLPQTSGATSGGPSPVGPVVYQVPAAGGARPPMVAIRESGPGR